MQTILESMWGAVQVAVQIGVQLALGPVLHRWRTRWGATDAETRLRLRGDELVPHPDWTYTHAVTIHAPRAAVWPWLVQVGQARSGFYSYEGLENLVGCDIHNVTTIRPELQRLRVGDTVRMHTSGFGPIVTILDRLRALVLGGPPNPKGSQATWALFLLDGPNGTTRLIERGRNVVGRGWRQRLGFGPHLVEPIGFVMSKKMLRTIKWLAETQVNVRPPVQTKVRPGPRLSHTGHLA
jgi:hypothetical protein